jgi:hypothetical protein
VQVNVMVKKLAQQEKVGHLINEKNSLQIKSLKDEIENISKESELKEQQKQDAIKLKEDLEDKYRVLELDRDGWKGKSESSDLLKNGSSLESIYSKIEVLTNDMCKKLDEVQIAKKELRSQVLILLFLFYFLKFNILVF